jgi:hypothetical protein
MAILFIMSCSRQCTQGSKRYYKAFNSIYLGLGGRAHMPKRPPDRLGNETSSKSCDHRGDADFVGGQFQALNCP